MKAFGQVATKQTFELQVSFHPCRSRNPLFFEPLSLHEVRAGGNSLELNTSKWSQIPFWNCQVGQKYNFFPWQMSIMRHAHRHCFGISPTLWTFQMIQPSLLWCSSPNVSMPGKYQTFKSASHHAFGFSKVLNCILKVGTCPTRVAEVTLSTVQPLALLGFERLQRDASQKRSQKYLYILYLYFVVKSIWKKNWDECMGTDGYSPCDLLFFGASWRNTGD